MSGDPTVIFAIARLSCRCNCPKIHSGYSTELNVLCRRPDCRVAREDEITSLNVTVNLQRQWDRTNSPEVSLPPVDAAATTRLRHLKRVVDGFDCNENRHERTHVARSHVSYEWRDHRRRSITWLPSALHKNLIFSMLSGVNKFAWLIDFITSRPSPAARSTVNCRAHSTALYTKSTTL